MIMMFAGINVAITLFVFQFPAHYSMGDAVVLAAGTVFNIVRPAYRV
jgi:hypothetical protein